MDPHSCTLLKFYVFNNHSQQLVHAMSYITFADGRMLESKAQRIRICWDTSILPMVPFKQWVYLHVFWVQGITLVNSRVVPVGSYLKEKVLLVYL